MKPACSWNLEHLMTKRGIRSASELARRLQACGHEITPKHAAAIKANPPLKLDLSLFAALMTALDCSASDLIGRQGTKAALPMAPPNNLPAEDSGVASPKANRKSKAAVVAAMPPVVLHPRPAATGRLGENT